MGADAFSVELVRPVMFGVQTSPTPAHFAFVDISVTQLEWHVYSNMRSVLLHLSGKRLDDKCAVNVPSHESCPWSPGVRSWGPGLALLVPSAGPHRELHVYSSGCTSDLGWFSCSSGSAPLAGLGLQTSHLPPPPSQELHQKTKTSTHFIQKIKPLSKMKCENWTCPE